jgi:hypothetical protein
LEEAVGEVTESLGGVGCAKKVGAEPRRGELFFLGIFGSVPLAMLSGGVCVVSCNVPFRLVVEGKFIEIAAGGDLFG